MSRLWEWVDSTEYLRPQAEIAAAIYGAATSSGNVTIMRNFNPSHNLDLPLEIAELIIDQIGDIYTLRSMGIVCRAYVHRCRTRLFHTIDLGDRFMPGEQYYRRFRDAMARYPVLRSYVRDLRLVDTAPFGSAEFLSADHFVTRQAWIAEDESMCELLESLPNIKAFSLALNKNALLGTGTSPMSMYQTSWDNFRLSIRHAILAQAKRPQLHSFSLAHIREFPAPLLVSLARVKHLVLTDVHLRDTPDSLQVISGVAAISAPRVEALTLRATDLKMLMVMNDVLKHHESTLKMLTIIGIDSGTEGAADAQVVDQLWHMLSLVAGTLQDFDWRPTTRNVDIALGPPRPIHLGILSRLRDFRFVVNFHSNSKVGSNATALTSPRGPFEQLLVLLDQLASESHYRYPAPPSIPNITAASAIASSSSAQGQTPTHGPSHPNPARTYPPPYESFASAIHNTLQTLTMEVMFMQSMQLIATSAAWAILDQFLSGGQFDVFDTAENLDGSQVYREGEQGAWKGKPKWQQSAAEPEPARSPRRFPSLREVVFTSRRRTSHEMKMRAREILVEQLPQCRARGISIILEGDLC